jgi:hypothetical protein
MKQLIVFPVEVVSILCHALCVFWRHTVTINHHISSRRIASNQTVLFMYQSKVEPESKDCANQQLSQKMKTEGQVCEKLTTAAKITSA